ncbi:MAG: hypothetical protein C5B52_15295 [Bacteroidetes bacterium]|nr:MAG: hypothetical protein C5B52_15295 [Bacteroidota bacterium]
MLVYQNNLIIELKQSNSSTKDEGGEEIFRGEESPQIKISDEYSNPWDTAHELKKQDPQLGFVEADLESDYHFQNPLADDSDLESFQKLSPCEKYAGYNSLWPFPTQKTGDALNEVWHLGDDFSQLSSARKSVAGLNNTIRIAHFDTGYDPTHICYDDKLIRHDLERNFVDDKTPFSAVDKYHDDLLEMPGHGTGTLGLLAGSVLDEKDWNFKDSIGLRKNIEIVPIRISDSVILFKNSAFAKALDYVISLYDDPSKRCHIVTMSMGGSASKLWADKVNEAYEKGIFIVSAAGNNFGRSTPRTLVYPARFNRVVAACGVTYDFSPYYKTFALETIKEMQGNFGPRKFMKTAIAAFTPNVPWARMGCRDVISLGGAGTSSATPQVASAAAIYYQKYYDLLEALPEAWMKPEAIRNAMFSTALKKINSKDKDIEIYFGNGILQANEMLKIAPDKSKLKKAEKDKISFSLFFQILSEISPFEVFEELGISEDEREMFETELQQLIQNSSKLQELLDHEEKDLEDLDKPTQEKFFNEILRMPEASNALKNVIKKQFNGENAKVAQTSKAATAAIKKPQVAKNMKIEWNQNLTSLNYILAGLYRRNIDEPEAVAEKAGVNTLVFELSGNPITFWYKLLRGVNDQGKMIPFINQILNPNERGGSADPAIKQTIEDLRDNLNTGYFPIIADGDVKSDFKAESGELQRIIGERSTLLPVSFLEKGLRSQKAVVRILVNGGKGSGFLIDNNWIITNNHVLPNEESAKIAVVQFNAQKTMQGIDADIEEFGLIVGVGHFFTSKADDWSCAKLNGDANKKYGSLEFSSAKVEVKDFVNIVQHPEGGPKQIAVYHNIVVGVDDDNINYLTDTLRGSSGSPVFNSDWEVVALHRKGGDTSLKDFENQTIYSNQGVNIKKIAAALKGLKIIN